MQDSTLTPPRRSISSSIRKFVIFLFVWMLFRVGVLFLVMCVFCMITLCERAPQRSSCNYCTRACNPPCLRPILCSRYPSVSELFFYICWVEKSCYTLLPLGLTRHSKISSGMAKTATTSRWRVVIPSSTRNCLADLIDRFIDVFAWNKINIERPTFVDRLYC